MSRYYSSGATGNSSVSSGGIGFCSLLAVAFIVLKLCGIITWSWWWVTAPIWIPIALVLILIGIIAWMKLYD